MAETITKTVKFLLVGDATKLSSTLSSASRGFQSTAKTNPFKGLGTDLKNAIKSGQGLKGVGGVLKNAATEAGGLGGMAKTAAIGVASVGAAAVVAGAAIAVKFGHDSVETFKRVAGEVSKVKRLTGMTAEDASRLNFAFKQTGVDSGAGAKALGIFSKGLAKMGDQDDAAKAKSEAAAAGIQKQIAALKSGGTHSAGYATKLAELNTKLEVTKLQGKSSSSVLAQMGIDYRTASGDIKPMADLMPALAEKFAKMPDGPQKTALAMKLFGKSGADLLPFLNKGAAGLAELAKKSDEFGNTLSDKQLQALKDSKAAQRDWDAAMQGLQVTLGANLLPLLTDGAKMLNSVAIPAFQKMAAWITKNQGTFDAMGKGMRWVWNNILLPIIKLAVTGFLEINKVLADAIMMLGAWTGKADLYKFGQGLKSAEQDVEDFVNGLEAIPEEVTPTVKVEDKGTAAVKSIDSTIKALRGKVVEAKAKGDASQVKALQKQINGLKGKKVEIEAALKKGNIGTIQMKVGKGGTMKFSAAASGGIFAAAGGALRSPRIFRQADGVQFNEPETRGESYIPLANDWRRPRAVAIWRQTGRELGQMAGGGLLGAHANAAGRGVVVELHVHAAVTQRADDVWETVRQGLIGLKNGRYGRRELGIA